VGVVGGSRAVRHVKVGWRAKINLKKPCNNVSGVARGSYLWGDTAVKAQKMWNRSKLIDLFGSGQILGILKRWNDVCTIT